ncbi:ATP-binding protein [Pseudomonas yamanorum]|uniref:Winged helix-turn-helix domain-containing protein n=1 Tax=Pseudomonas yamanorum TaxID=515393 RepID=A0AAJ3H9G3_9PSED|nr:winged helix-turn-helix domain-containing protein [Pseudomonas yamanorum]NWD46261.1 winged helix-turn-helix domain-containing protein [Pseudomonas yamanorum]
MSSSKYPAVSFTDLVPQAPDHTENAIGFGPFLLLARQHVLLRNGEPVTLGSRALYLLIALASRAGELLEKSELISFAWPKVVVEECNLRAQIVALRRALGDDGNFSYIVTVPGRGYRFVAPVTMQAVSDGAMTQALLPAPTVEAPNLQPPPGTVIGREQLILSLADQLLSQRFLTITGPGGIGKTTVALAVAQLLQGRFHQGMCFVDLAPATSGQWVAGMLANALGIQSVSDDPLQSVASMLANSPLLLVLDNCEHVLQATADAVEVLLRCAPQCCVLTTSREPLRAEGERVHDLAPLLVPDEDLNLSAEQAMAWSGIALFIERVKALDPGFVFKDTDVAAASAICRKLDSNALAIEIAAARVRTFGIQDLVGLLDGSFRLQMTGRRTALARHRSLSATLDWTYSMLTGDEQAMLRQLAVFTGSFTLDAVKAMTASSALDARNALPLLESLMDKSLLIAGESQLLKRYRLLETTRAYALEKLNEHGEADATRQRHARYALEVLQEAGQTLDSLSPEIWVGLYGPEINTVRAALEWAFSASGDLPTGIELTLGGVPLWLRLSLVSECRTWVDKGLAIADTTPLPLRQRMLLQTALASVLMLTYGTGGPMREAWRQVREDARDLGDAEHKLRALWGLWSDRCGCNQYAEALELAERYISLSHSGNQQLLGKRMRAVALFHMGDLAGARQNIDEALGSPSAPRSHIIDVHFDQRIAARCLKAKVQLLEGDVDPALRLIGSCVDEAITLDHPATLWYTLCLGAIPLALLASNLPKVRYYLGLLQGSTTQQDLHIWRQFRLCFESILLIRQGSPEEGVPLLGEALHHLSGQGDSQLYSLLRCEYALGLARLGLEKLALEVLEDTLQLALGRHEHWFVPQMLRIKAQLILRQAQYGSVDKAKVLLRQAWVDAQLAGAHFWRAQIASDLARLQEPKMRIASLPRFQHR